MIKGVSDIRRLPRLGKIRLGEKAVSASGNPYPKALDYFNCPPVVQAIYGEKPRTLDIMFPVEDQSIFFPQWYKRYGKTTGLVCKGDGETATIIDQETGEMVEIDCTPDECEWYGKKHCRRLANLQFLLPRVPGLGVWQIDSTSFFSIVNINSGLEMIKAVAGKVSMLPLQLILKPQEVTPDGKKKTVFVLDLVAPVTLGQLLVSSQKTAVQLLMPALNEDDKPEDLYPDGVLNVDGQEGGLAPFDLSATEEQPTQAWEQVDPLDAMLEDAFEALGATAEQRAKSLSLAGGNKEALLMSLSRKIDSMNAGPPPVQKEPKQPSQAPAQQPLSFF